VSRRKTTSEFIQEAQAVHGDLYDYSKVEYTTSNNKVLIIDPEYGEFWQAPLLHIRGSGHPTRGKIKSQISGTKTTEQFIKEASKVHNNLYDYSKTEYEGVFTKVIVIDPEYGEFLVTPANHLKGRGNPIRGAKSTADAKRLTKEEFIERARRAHGGLYDYSEVEYINDFTKVKIIDPEYGEFWQIPGNHIKGHGNPKRTGLYSLTTDEFIEEANKVHNNLYDYSKTAYKYMANKVLIIDPDYGEFWQQAQSHLRGRGNPIRNGGIRFTTSDFIRKAREVHGDLYDYSKVDYVNAHTKVLIVDPDYGEFWQKPNHHLTGSNNPARVGGVADTQQDFIKKAKEVHGDLYDYSLVKYVNSLTKVKIIDPDYGVFEQSPSSHLIGSDSPGRSGAAASDRQRMSQDEFVSRASKIHKGLYDYSKVNYQGYNEPVTIIDPEYGEFEQKPSSHLKGSGHMNRAHFGFNINLPAILYYLKVQGGKGYKIGITNRTVAERFVGEADKIEVIKTWYYESGKDARDREQEVLSKYKSMKYIGEHLLSSGNTELFNKDILELDV